MAKFQNGNIVMGSGKTVDGFSISKNIGKTPSNIIRVDPDVEVSVGNRYQTISAANAYIQSLPEVEVTGATTTAVNGLYKYQGVTTSGSWPYYQHVENTTYFLFENYASDAWVIAEYDPESGGTAYTGNDKFDDDSNAGAYDTWTGNASGTYNGETADSTTRPVGNDAAPSMYNKWAIEFSGFNDESTVTVYPYVVIMGNGFSQLNGTVNTSGLWGGTDYYEYSIRETIVADLGLDNAGKIFVLFKSVLLDASSSSAGGLIGVELQINNADCSSLTSTLTLIQNSRIDGGTYPSGTSLQSSSLSSTLGNVTFNGTLSLTDVSISNSANSYTFSGAVSGQECDFQISTAATFNGLSLTRSTFNGLATSTLNGTNTFNLCDIGANGSAPSYTSAIDFTMNGGQLQTALTINHASANFVFRGVEPATSTTITLTAGTLFTDSCSGTFSVTQTGGTWNNQGPLYDDTGDILITATTMENAIKDLDTAINNTNADVQALNGSSHTQDTDTKILVNDTSVIITDTGANGTITFKADNNIEAEITDAGLRLGGGNATVNEIDIDGTLLANSDTRLSTQKAIKTYVDAIHSPNTDNKIIAADTEVSITDSGPGTITFKADSNIEMTISDSGVQLASGATINEFSIDDTLAGDSDTAVPTEQAVKAYVDNKNTVVSTADVSIPPTDAELDSTFGTPATVGAGFTRYIDDNGGGTNFYQVVSDGTNWWIFTGIKAV